MKLCGGCERYILAREPSCPFCATGRPTAPLPRNCGVLAAFGLSVMLGGTACGPSSPNPIVDGASSSSEGGGSETVGASTGGSTSSPLTDSGASTETGADSSEGGPVDEGGSFYAGAPDGGTTVFECDMFAQDCPEGEKCMPWGHTGASDWTATRCSPVAPDPNEVGETCTVEGSAYSGIDDCALGAMCFGVDAKTNEGTCEEICGGTPASPECTDEIDICTIGSQGALVVCLPACNPMLGECGEGEGCFPAGDEFSCAPSQAAAAMHGDGCAQPYTCASGQVCVDAALHSTCDEGFCCTSICDLSDVNANADCAALDPEQVCLPWYEPGMAPAGYEDLGVCGREA